MKRVGLIGFGVIGSYLFRRIEEEGVMEVGFVFEVDRKKTESITPSLILTPKLSLYFKWWSDSLISRTTEHTLFPILSVHNPLNKASGIKPSHPFPLHIFHWVIL